MSAQRAGPMPIPGGSSMATSTPSPPNSFSTAAKTASPQASASASSVSFTLTSPPNIDLTSSSQQQMEAPPLSSSSANAEGASTMSNAPPTDDDIESLITRVTSQSALLAAAGVVGGAMDNGRQVGKDTRTQLFVGNLPYRVRWQDLKDLFRRAGTVLRADVALTPASPMPPMPPSNSPFPYPRLQPSTSSPFPQPSLYPHQQQQQQQQQSASANVPQRSLGYGTVLLATAADAGRAVDMFNGFSWMGRTLEVRLDRLAPEVDTNPGNLGMSKGLSASAPVTMLNQAGGVPGLYNVPAGLLQAAGMGASSASTGGITAGNVGGMSGSLGGVDAGQAQTQGVMTSAAANGGMTVQLSGAAGSGAFYVPAPVHASNLPATGNLPSVSAATMSQNTLHGEGLRVENSVQQQQQQHALPPSLSLSMDSALATAEREREREREREDAILLERLDRLNLLDVSRSPLLSAQHLASGLGALGGLGSFGSGSGSGTGGFAVGGGGTGERPMSAGNGATRSLFVGNLPFHTQWQDLKDLFRRACAPPGQSSFSRSPIPSSSGFGNNSPLIGGSSSSIGGNFGRGDGSWGSANGSAGGGGGSGSSSGILRADVALGPDGRSRGYGTVVFASAEEAERAREMFDGFEYNGRVLKVHYDKFSAPTPLQSSIYSSSSGGMLGVSRSSPFLNSNSTSGFQHQHSPLSVSRSLGGQGYGHGSPRHGGSAPGQQERQSSSLWGGASFGLHDVLGGEHQEGTWGSGRPGTSGSSGSHHGHAAGSSTPWAARVPSSQSSQVLQSHPPLSGGSAFGSGSGSAGSTLSSRRGSSSNSAVGGVGVGVGGVPIVNAFLNASSSSTSSASGGLAGSSLLPPPTSSSLSNLSSTSASVSASAPSASSSLPSSSLPGSARRGSRSSSHGSGSASRSAVQASLQQALAAAATAAPTLSPPQTESIAQAEDQAADSRGSGTTTNGPSPTSARNTQHPAHPGPIALPPPPSVAGGGAFPGMAPGFYGGPQQGHVLSPLMGSPLGHPYHHHQQQHTPGAHPAALYQQQGGYPTYSPLHHPGAVLMTPHGLPPITPSMPSFSFVAGIGMGGTPLAVASPHPAYINHLGHLYSPHGHGHGHGLAHGGAAAGGGGGPALPPHPGLVHTASFSPGMMMSPGAYWGRPVSRGGTGVAPGPPSRFTSQTGDDDDARREEADGGGGGTDDGEGGYFAVTPGYQEPSGYFPPMPPPPDMQQQYAQYYQQQQQQQQEPSGYFPPIANEILRDPSLQSSGHVSADGAEHERTAAAMGTGKERRGSESSVASSGATDFFGPGSGSRGSGTRATSTTSCRTDSEEYVHAAGALQKSPLTGDEETHQVGTEEGRAGRAHSMSESVVGQSGSSSGKGAASGGRPQIVKTQSDEAKTKTKTNAHGHGHSAPISQGVRSRSAASTGGGGS